MMKKDMLIITNMITSTVKIITTITPMSMIMKMRDTAIVTVQAKETKTVEKRRTLM